MKQSEKDPKDGLVEYGLIVAALGLAIVTAMPILVEKLVPYLKAFFGTTGQ